ncbi:ATP-binding protein [Streptomyces sp. NBC_00481]|uniref:ATP-binding protein n=1 Tax=unclassified Streptomyces TaxID=2593676 RepID=UPI002DDBD2E5|nr:MULTISPECIES: ATP-binding protein [unclassified Streptomyces]WRY97621.1 ATP-binding protein [Streptomyces sp. NBC_00481]
MPEVTAQRNYPTTKRSVARARTDCRDFLKSCGLPGPLDVVDDIVLVVSELMTNAVIHGRVSGTSGRQVRMAIEKTGDVIRVEVRDTQSDKMPRLCEGSGHDLGRRGLVLVDVLADSWGVKREAIGKTVWAEKRFVR